MVDSTNNNDELSGEQILM
ncbi:unnamed protein product, partial [Rotaria socialis]